MRSSDDSECDEHKMGSDFEEERIVEEGDNQDNPDFEELEKEYRDAQRELNIVDKLKNYKNEDVLKGKAVKNQKALWDKTLELRFLLQKPFTNSNRLPRQPARSLFCRPDEVSKAYQDLITSSRKTLDSLLELQQSLVEKNPSFTQPEGRAKKSEEEEVDAEWSRVRQSILRIASYRDISVDKWQRKTEVTSGAASIRGNLHVFNQNISEQVAAYMRDPSRMINNMRQKSSAVSLFGAEGSGVEDGDVELVDDSEFYQQLLKEFFESFDPTSSESVIHAVRMQTRKRKAVDRRASKSRKIRYHVHEKLVNFMVPKLMSRSSATTLDSFKNLFGQNLRKPSTTSQALSIFSN